VAAEPIEATPAATAGADAAPAPAPQEPAAAAGKPDRSNWVRNELRGAPYERATTASLAALPPRELTGSEADERARRAFLALDDKERRDLLEWFGVECEKLGTFQESLIRFVVDGEERAPSSWPELQPLVWYDPAVHAAAQPIPREPLAPDAPEVVAVRHKILAAPGSRRLDSGWMVDYGARALVRLPRADDPVRVFENALLGMAPDWDLAEALVELRLDDGSHQKEFQAFAHAYTDRWGGVYPGVTLYDAQASLTQIEMPDVDALGIVHELLGDWETWKPPVASELQTSLYEQIGALFRPLLHHRGLRASLARAYLCGNAELRDSYRFNLDNFHALWESAASDPATLRERLPDEAGWRDFLQGWSDSIAGTELYFKGTNRHATLDRDAQSVRETLLRLLDEYGALERVEKMPPYDR
jgi:hypothetical protein